MSGDIGQIQVGKPPSGVRPVAPIVPNVATPAPAIVIPSGGNPRRGRLILIVIIAVVVIAIAVAVLTSLGGGSTTATPTPTPTASTSPSPTVTAQLQGKTLDGYFGKPSGTDQTTAPEAGLFRSIDEPAPITLPTPLSTAVGPDRAWLVFGQNELYGTTGQLLSASTVEARAVAVYELTGVSAARQAMQAWEMDTMSQDLAGVLGYNAAKAAPSFVGGTYKNMTVRYKNFPYPDHALDWSVVTGSNGKSYLVIAGSRQSMFAAIDGLLQ